MWRGETPKSAEFQNVGLSLCVRVGVYVCVTPYHTPPEHGSGCDYNSDYMGGERG
jgi:hypothetical protein